MTRRSKGRVSAGPGGVLLVDKPKGPTSHAVVERIRRALGAAKAGHAGTLDPAATGLLVVCADDAVKVQHWLADGDKGYEATVAFGAATDTEDAEGQVVERGDPAGLHADPLGVVLRGFVGEIDQLPPMYSAVRVGGRRLHQAARAGEEVERSVRRVAVHALTLRSLSPCGEDGLREARIEVHCGKGTYVRTLAADLGRALGVPAHLRGLRRTVAGHFRVEDAIGLDEAERLAERDPALLRQRMLPLAEALPFPPVTVEAEGARWVVNGRFLPAEGPDGLRRVIGPDGGLVAVAQVRHGRLRPVRVFATLASLEGEGTGQNH
jgi:tRNA pseudouridine55 synthase